MDNIKIIKLQNNSFIYGFLAGICLIFIAMTGCIYMMVGNAPHNYSFIIFLPLLYIAISFINISLFKYLFCSLPVFCLLGGYFVRMVLTPILFSLGGYKSFLHITIPADGVVKAVLLLSFEYFAVCLAINLFAQKKRFANKGKAVNLHKYNLSYFKTCLLIILIFLVFVYLYIPQIKTVYPLLFNIKFTDIVDIRWDNESIVRRGTLQRYFYSLFCFFNPIIRNILPSFLIFYFYKKYGKKKLSAFLSFFCMLIPFIVLGGFNIEPFISFVLCLIVLRKLYGKRVNRVIGIVGTIGFIAISIVIMAKISSLSRWRGGSGVAIIAQFLNAYLPGFDNMAALLSMENVSKLKTLFFDIYYAIPFKNTLFGLKGENLNDLFNIYVDTGGQIISFGSQIAHYGSLVVASASIGIISHLALNAEDKAKRTDNFWEYFSLIYFSLITSVSISIYSFSIYLNNLINVALPILIITSLVREKKRLGKLNKPDITY